uniref:Uncharacterized protein n=1 Tax=Chenopodium quinoa TaxID=63459 RepID=A0A803N416_CHEQI
MDMCPAFAEFHLPDGFNDNHVVHILDSLACHDDVLVCSKIFKDEVLDEIFSKGLESESLPGSKQRDNDLQQCQFQSRECFGSSLQIRSSNLQRLMHGDVLSFFHLRSMSFVTFLHHAISSQKVLCASSRSSTVDAAANRVSKELVKVLLVQVSLPTRAASQGFIGNIQNSRLKLSSRVYCKWTITNSHLWESGKYVVTGFFQVITRGIVWAQSDIKLHLLI